MPRFSHGVPRRRRRVSSSSTDVRRVDMNASTTSPANKKSTPFSQDRRTDEKNATERHLTRFLVRRGYVAPFANQSARIAALKKVIASKPKRIYAPRIISDHIMMQEDFERLYKFLLETEGLSEVSDDMRELVEQEWPELVHKLPPKAS